MAHRFESSPQDPASPVDDIFEGTPYRLERPLDHGGMGDVFLVAHRSIGKRFVAKVPRVELVHHRSILDRLRLEAESLAQLLDSPHIVTIQGHGQLLDGRPFFVTEYLRGRTLKNELDERKQLPVLEALDLACQLLRALEDAHALGIVHRDIKPDNLFLCLKPHGGYFLKVLDFGIVRIMPDAPEGAPAPLETRTDTGTIVGTPQYISPEGAVGARVDGRADIYAAALVLYLMLAGRGPFDHVSGDALLLVAHAAEDAAPPSQYASEPVPPELDNALLRALCKDPADRFQTAVELRAELERVAELLQHTQGWLQTSAFDLASRSNVPRGVRAQLMRETAAARIPAVAEQGQAHFELVRRSVLDDVDDVDNDHVPMVEPSNAVRIAVLFFGVMTSVIVTIAVFKHWGMLP